MRSSLPTLTGALVRPLGAAALATALVLPFGAAAWTSGATIAGAALVDITPAGFDALVALLPALIPSAIVVPDQHIGPQTIDATVFGIGAQARAGLDITNININVAIGSAAIVPQTDYLAFDAATLVGVGTPTSQMNIHGWVDTRWCFFGCGSWGRSIDANCPVYVEPAAVDLGADIALEVKDDQLVPYLDASLTGPIAWDLNDVNLRGDCLVGDIFEIADDLGIDIEGLLLDALRPQLDAPIQDLGETITATIEDAFGQASIEQEVALGESVMTVAIHPDDVTIVPEGVRLSLAGSFASTTNPCVAEYGHFESMETPGGDPAIGSVESGIPSPHHVGIFIDDDLLNQALFAVYNGGALCFELGEDSGLPINTALLGILSPALGDLFPTSQPLTIKTRPAEVPTAAPSGDHDLNVVVDKLGVDFVGQLDFRNATILAADLHIDAGVDIALDQTVGALAIDVPLSGDDLIATIRLNEFAPGEDEAIAGAFGGLFDSVVGPLLDGVLGNLSFALPAIAAGTTNLGLNSLEWAASGPDHDMFGAYANVGPVAYSGGCDDSGGGCATGCGTGEVPVRAVLFPLALAAALARRRRS